MGPVVVRCRLRGAMVDNGNPVHLDGLLALAWAIRHPQYARVSRLDDPATIQTPHLPLERLEHAGSHIWLASAALLDGHEAPSLVWQTRRRDADDYDRLAGPVDTQAGPRKDVLLRRQARLVTGFMWFAWGSVREIRRSLRLLWGREDSPHGAVGSARRSGAGHLVRWSCERGGHARVECIIDSDSEGVLRRHVPAVWLDGAERIRAGAVRPPYWHPRTQEATGAVGARASLSFSLREALGAQDAD